MKEENFQLELKSLKEKIKNEELNLRSSFSRLSIASFSASASVEKNRAEDEAFMQEILFEKENLKFELAKAKQEVKYLEDNKKNDEDFLEQVVI